MVLKIFNSQCSCIFVLIHAPCFSSLSRMKWRLCYRSRTICLLLAFLTLFLHLLLAFASLHMYHQPCDPPLPPRTHILRDLAHTYHTSAGSSGPAEPPTGASHRDSSRKDANKDTKGHETPLSNRGLAEKEGGKDSRNMSVSVGHHGSASKDPEESGLSKLQALFDHPLYNMPGPQIPEEDRLLQVKMKVRASEKSSQMWSVSDTVCELIKKKNHLLFLTMHHMKYA